MLSNFKADLEAAKEAEEIVRAVFTSLTTGYTFENVRDQKQYYYKGDIKAVAADGREIYIEVKDDSRIAETRRILCEEENYIKDSDYYIKGNMYSNYDIYTIVSKAEKKIYVLDFKKL